MVSFVRVMYYGLLTVCVGVELSSVAADGARRYIFAKNITSAEEIIAHMADQGPYDIRVQFDARVTPADRTALLNVALAHERAANIVELDLVGNELVYPPVLTGLVNLERVFLGVNALVEPPVVTGLSHLRWLGLGMNRLTHAPALEGVPNLQILTLNNNQLTEPPALAHVQYLHTLELSHNRLTRPPVLAGAVNLRTLSLDNNQLVEPPVLAGLTSLRALTLLKNMFRRPVIIPPVIADHLNLQYIRVPYQIGQESLNQAEVAEQKAAAQQMELLDIGVPGSDAVPFFYTAETLRRLPRNGHYRQNPMTRQGFIFKRRLAESWRLWRDEGLSAEIFDEKLRDIEPVMFDKDLYMVERSEAREFMHERGMAQAAIFAILARLEGEYINVTRLLDAMSLVQQEQHVPVAAAAAEQAIDDSEVASAQEDPLVAAQADEDAPQPKRQQVDADESAMS